MIGFSLVEARELLDGEPVVIETRPPFEPRHYTPIYGEWRVIRVRTLENGQTELCVARELLREEKSAPLR